MTARRPSERIYRYRHVGEEEDASVIQCPASDGIRHLLIMNGKLCDRAQDEAASGRETEYRQLYQTA